MYKCKKCNKIFDGRETEAVEVYKGKFYCKACGTALEELSTAGTDVLDPILGTSGLMYSPTTDNTVNSNSHNKHNSENTSIVNSGNTTNIYYGDQNRHIQTKDGLRICKECKEFIPFTNFDVQSGLCHECFDKKMIKESLALIELGMYHDAIQRLEKTNRNGVQTELAKHYLGVCYMSMNDWKKAVVYFATSKSIADSLAYLGEYFNTVQNDIEKSIEYFNMAKVLGSKKAESFLILMRKKSQIIIGISHENESDRCGLVCNDSLKTEIPLNKGNNIIGIEQYPMLKYGWTFKKRYSPRKKIERTFLHDLFGLPQVDLSLIHI